jgi:Lanthionine-containing peptide SapB precursor RamS
MALMDLQGMTPEEAEGHGSNLSVTGCGGRSGISILCSSL